MKLELEVLASTSIKRKKPWPRMAWIGEKQESIYLIDDHRMSVLYVPSGKTKKKIPKLHGILADVTTLNHSDDGSFLVGLLRSGDVFIFHKDTDMLKYIQGMNDLVYSLPNVSNNANRPHIPIDPPKPQIFIADDGTKVVVLMNLSKIYVWEQDADQHLFAAKRIDVKGTWSQVRPSPTVPLPSPSARECSVSAVFFIHDVLGLCCSISFVFTIDRSVSFTTAVIRWYEAHNLVTYSAPTFYMEWSNVKYPLCKVTQDGGPVRALGAYLCRPSHDGQLLATVINQKNSLANKMVFLSPLTDVFVVTDLKGSGAKTPSSRNYRSYWVTAMAWTGDDLFVVTMTSQGSVAVITRLGEPLLLKTFGCSIEMGPRYYLPLHPLISIQAPREEGEEDGPGDAEMYSSERDPMRQRYSICCHPRKPIILCSDGYMVTALQLPVEMTCLSLMKGLVMESNRHLRRIRDSQKINLTLYDSMRRQGRVTKKLSLSGGVAGSRRVPKVTSKSVGPSGLMTQAYRFEEPDEDALNTTIDDDDTAVGTDVFTGNIESGKIFFGDMDNMNCSVDLDASNIEETMSVVQLLEQAKSTLLLAWALGASHCGLWTEEHEEVATNIAHNMVRLFSVIMLSSAEVVKDLEALHVHHIKKGTNVKNLSLVIILQTVKSLLRLLHLDAPYQHLMVCAVRFAHSTLKLFLTDSSLAKREPKLHTLHGCFTLLKVFEQSILSVYTPLPKNAILNGMNPGMQQEFNSVYEPATACMYKDEKTAIVTDVTPGYELHGEAPHQRKLIRPKPGEEEQEEMRRAQTYTSDIDRRLVPVWKLLYKHIVGFYTTHFTQKPKATIDGPLQELLITVQMKLTKLGQPSLLSPMKKTKVQPGDRLSIEGCSVPALKAWMYQLNMAQGQSPNIHLSQRFLLSTLYSLLLQDELRAAIELTELLLKLPDLKSAVSACRQDQATKWSTLAKLHEDPSDEASDPPRLIQNEAVKAVVRSIARIMAAYFSNQTLFVFPPHAPRIIPPLHKTYKLDHRLIPLYHESLANVIRTDGLDGVWTVERAMEYLLIAGLLPEAVWLASTLGDWKTAFVMGVAHLEHQLSFPNIYSEDKKVMLPQALHPETLLQSKLAQNFGLNTSDEGVLLIDEETDMPHLRRTLSDLMLAATLSRIDLVPWLMEGLVARLKHVCKQFSAIVPSGLYLPAPPVYCPQPANTSQAGLNEDASVEVALRHQASSLIQLVFLVLEGSNSILPAARWYAKRTEEAVQLGKKFKTITVTLDEPDIPVLQESFLGKGSSFLGKEADPSIHRILASYRDFTSLVWMLYVRDKLSLGLRKKIQLIDRKMHKSPVPKETWLKHCRDTLEWATHLVTFAHFLQAENDIFGITLSLITELPTDVQTCNLLSLFFHDAENMDPEIQDKLQTVLKDWQGVFLDCAQTPRGTKLTPRGTSMSFYFHKQSQRMEKYYRKKAKVFGQYEAFVFDHESEEQEREVCGSVSDGINSIGSRPFESTGSFLSFLDVFYAVSFHKLVDAEEVTPTQMPLLSANSTEFRKKELTSFTHKAVTSLHKKQSASDGFTSPQTSLSDLSGVKNIAPPSRPKPPSSPRGKIGLFRSRSFSEISSKKSFLPPRSPSVERRKSSSHHDLSSLDDRGFLDLHTTKPGSTATQISPKGSSLKTQTQRTTSGSDTLLTADGIVPKMSLTRKCEIRRSCSVNDVDQAKKDKERTKNSLPQVDPLLRPVMAAALLDKLNFGKKYIELEQLLEWLSRWSARSHNLSSKTEHQVISGQTSLSASLASQSFPGKNSPFKNVDFSKSFRGVGLQSSSAIKPVMRIRVQTRLLVYSLWLIENNFKQPEHSELGREACEQANNSTFSATGTLNMGTGLDTGPFPNTQAQVPPHSAPDQEPGKSDGHARSDGPAKENVSSTKDSYHWDDDIDVDVTDVQSEWLDHQELESSYIAQILSAESNESISDGVIPKPKKKMGILKKKKKKKEKSDDGGQSTPSVGTSETLLRRLSFKAGSKGSQDPAAVQAHNTSQVSDSTLNVSSLNEEEMQDPLRETVRLLRSDSGTKIQKQRPEISDPIPIEKASDKVPLLKMTNAVPDTRLDLRQLERPPHDEDDPDDLRHIVRQELRKIVDAQHRGILAMLGALGEDEDIPLGASTPHESSSSRKEKKHKGKKKSRRPDIRQEGYVLNATQETSFNDRSSLTEVDVTPLPSDEISLKSNDNPLTVSDLFKSKTWSPGSRFEAREVGSNVRGALRELKLLENSQSPNPNHVHFELQNNARAAPGKGGKENKIQRETVQEQMNQPGPSNQYQGPANQARPHHQMFNQQGHTNQQNNIPDTNQPFARVFEMLKAFNHSITPNGTGASQTGVGTQGSNQHQSQGMPLLHMNSAPSGQSVRFPPVHVPPPQMAEVGGTASAGVPRMPLLHLYTPHHRDEVPVRDVQLRFPPHPHAAQVHGGPPGHSAPPRMPLLKLHQPPHERVFQHIEDQHGDLHLVPAEDLQAYEARLQVEKEKKLEQRRKQMEALGLTGPPEEAVRKQEQRSQRQSDKRRQRRQKLEDEETLQAGNYGATSVKFQEPDTRELEMSSQYVQADPISTATQEVQVTYTPTPRDMASRGAQYPTPRELEEDEESEDQPEAAIHHGYALTPGLFDEYLTKDREMGTALDNAARLQYQAVSGLKPRRLKEVGTETDGPGWTEQGTVISRDQGTDPVTEAIEAYTRAKQGLNAQGILAPDVFMGLKFSETSGGAAAEESAAGNRAFINVVDLDGAALDDIVSSVRDRESRSAREPSRVKTPRSRRTPSPEKTHERSRVHYEDEVEDIPLGPDRVTQGMLSHRSERSNRASHEWDSAITQSARSQAKGSIRQRLGNMEAQFEAIDAMSRNIQDDYKNARLMIHTIEQIGEAMHPTADLESEDSEQQERITPRGSPKRSARKPSQARFREQDPDKPSPIPEVSEEGQSSTRSQVRISQESAGLEQDSRIDITHSEHQEVDTKLDLTGLSGVSDIIGEVIASGGVDASELGLSDRQSQRLAEKATSARDTSDLDDLLRSGEMQRDQEIKSQQRKEKERAELRAWMEEKKRQRMEDFRRRQQELREREHVPFKGAEESAHMSTLTMKELEEFEQRRVSNKKQREVEYAEKRRMEASKLMGDILTDRPELPDPLPVREPVRKRTPSMSPVRRGKSASPARRTTSKSPARKDTVLKRGSQLQRAAQRHAWESDPDRVNVHMDDLRNVRDSRDYDRQFRHSGEQQNVETTGGRKSGLLSGSGFLNTQTGTSSAGLRAYTQHLEHVQSSYDPDSEAGATLQADTTQEQDKTEAQAVHLCKPKPFTKMVKMQRPEMTRQNRPRPQAKPYVERLSEVSKTEDTPRSDMNNAILSKQRLYGTKRLPGTQSVRTAPRTVKTYQERLREMKQARQENPSPVKRYTGPVRATGSTFTRPVPHSVTKKVKKPRKKPLTYQEQLQALQPPKELYRTGTLNTSSTLERSRPKKRKGPPHKPLTYSQQLQALQPPKELYRSGTMDYPEEYQTDNRSSAGQSQVYRSPPKNILRRSGPYPNPYTKYNPEEDRASVVSPWSVDDDVRKLLYNDGASSTYVGASVTGTEIDISELEDLAGVSAGLPEYTDLVDVQDLADVASVSEGSIMSFIDWDQVNDLIADVY